ncbi:hypothetical protein FHT44_006109 [Mycolicibacterium sp. BK634]|uniref:DUF2332 domain-containing protein n=1 Tax=Mycolicibacterium sp. BK634 TaxID=2587099 RepID=UPI001615C449|nr:hypothetical protein [Mycolicibacterium sp. BK634]
MDVGDRIAELYGQFADQQAHGSSPSLESWARSVVVDHAVLSRLAELPEAKRQPNLVFACLRWNGARPGDPDSLRDGILGDWERLRTTIMARSTQTNEPARCAVLLPLLHQIPGPIALIEIGAAAGLCLIPDHYSYRYSDGTVVHPPAGPSPVVIGCEITAGDLPLQLSTPDVVWRAGLDLNPLDASDSDTAAWLTALIWPEHDDRRDRLSAALDVAAKMSIRIDRGDLRDGLGALLADVPAGVTPVIQHSATLAYLSPEERSQVAAMIAQSKARWISFEGRGVISVTAQLPESSCPADLFVAALDRRPIATSSGHGDTMAVLDLPSPST